MKSTQKILFITGTRADFGKMKSLITEASKCFNVQIFVTGMHLLPRFGSTWNEVRDLGVGEIFPFVNQNENDTMTSSLAKTIQGISDFMIQSNPDLIVVHGDRIETLAGAIVGSLTNTIVAHIEGGEVSGTVDEMIRHAVTKLSTYHFVSNSDAVQNLMQMGEDSERIFEVGSPDVDTMFSDSLPSLREVKNRYKIPYQNYAIAILHPVTTEIEELKHDAKIFFQTLKNSEKSFIIIYPNNDKGHEIINEEIQKLSSHSKFRVFPSLRFEYFLTALKYAEFIIGNSSAGVREAPYYGVPCIDVGTRQDGRIKSPQIQSVDFEETQISVAISSIDKIARTPSINFGTPGCGTRVLEILQRESFWKVSTQKKFYKRALEIVSD
jgi:UDP-N-acetylglucosamine 2-epimerase (hydrolysing)